MVWKGTVRGGVVVLEDAQVLPEGTVVRVETVDEPASAGEQGLLALSGKLLHLAGTVKDLPADMARNHDHYLHGHPKK